MEENEDPAPSEHSAASLSDGTAWESSAASAHSDRGDSPHPEKERRRSARLHQPGRAAHTAGSVDGDEDDKPTVEHVDPVKAGPAKKLTKGKVEYGMKYPPVERLMNPNVNRLWDAFCWRCHKQIPLKEQRGCPGCIRVYHGACWWNFNPSSSRDLHMDTHSLSSAASQSEDELESDGFCLDCYCIMEEIKRPSSVCTRVGMPKFKTYLSHMMRFVNEHLPEERVRPFAIPLVEQDELDDVKVKYAELITHPMDLRQIKNNIEEDKYQTCTSFLADLKWVQHNTSIFNGQNSRYTHSACYIVETCQNLCYSLEWCMECFERGMPQQGETIHHAIERAMVQPCSDPHAVVWVKAEKYPIWPAIVYRFNGMTADVRFFGAFEFGVFPKDAIFLYTNKYSKSKQKGKVKLEYENALAQYKRHVAKLQRLSGKTMVAYPKNTPYDGRLRMFPESDIEPHTEEPEIPMDVMEPLAVELPKEEPEEEERPEKRARSSSPATISQPPSIGNKRIRLINTLSPPSELLPDPLVEEPEPVPPVGSPEVPEVTVESHGGETQEAHSPFPASPELAELTSKSRRKRLPLRFVRRHEEVPASMAEEAPMPHETVVMNTEENANETVISVEEVPAEPVRPVALEDEPVEGEMPSFEMPEDGQEARIRSAGKLDLMLKRPPNSPPKDANPGVENVRTVMKTGIPPRPLGALAQELGKPSPPMQGRSVLHDVLRFQGIPPQDPMRKARKQGMPSMASGQSHLIEALRGSPRPLASGPFGEMAAADRPNPVGPSDNDSVQVTPADSGAESDGRPRSGGAFRQETLGSLLAAGIPAASRNDAGSILSRMVQAPATPQQLAYGAQRAMDVRSQLEARRLSMSGPLRFTPSRANLMRPSESVGDPSVQKSILTRSLNTPTVLGSRFASPAPSGAANGSMARGSPAPTMVGLNGDRMSPALQQHMQQQQQAGNLRPNPAWNTQATAAERVAAAVAANNRNIHPQADTAQLQVEMFLRNTKKAVREKKVEGAQVMRELAQIHADAQRVLQESHTRSQVVSEKLVQDLQDTMEQNVKKFEILFGVYQSEMDFAQKAKVLEVTRMKDLERQRAITAAKRTLWCCVCQKRAKLLCCGVTTYCSESCQRNNAPIHRMHCQRLRVPKEEDGEANVYTPFGLLQRCVHNLADLADGGGGVGHMEAPNGWLHEGDGQ